MVDDNTRVTLPKMMWRSKSSSLSSFKNDLPQIVWLDNNSGLLQSDQGIAVDENYSIFLNTPFLAYKFTESVKIIASVLQEKLDEKGELKGLNEIIISDKYDSTEASPRTIKCSLPKECNLWFTRLHSKIEMFRTPAEMIRTDVSTFLVNKSTKGLRLHPSNEDELEEILIENGTVLRIERLTSGCRKSSVSQIELTGTLLKRLIRYIQCLTEDNEYVFIKINKKGQYYPVTRNNICKPDSCVMQIKNIIQNEESKLLTFPMDIVLKFGDKPKLNFFSKYLRLYNKLEENIIVCSTIQYHNNVLFELPADECPMKFHLSVYDAYVINSPAYQRAITYCDRQFDVYLSDIKRYTEAFFKQNKLLKQNSFGSDIFDPETDPKNSDTNEETDDLQKRQSLSTICSDVSSSETIVSQGDNDAPSIKVDSPKQAQKANVKPVRSMSFSVSTFDSGIDSLGSGQTRYKSRPVGLVPSNSPPEENSDEEQEDMYETFDENTYALRSVSQHFSMRDTIDEENVPTSGSKKRESKNKGKLKYMSTEELCEFMENLNVSETTLDQIRLNKIDGNLLLSLSDDHIAVCFAIAPVTDKSKIEFVITAAKTFTN